MAIISAKSNVEKALGDVVVHYAKPDRPWADWIAWVLEEQGYGVTLPERDSEAGSNFFLDLLRETEAETKIVLLSEASLKIVEGRPEMAKALMQDSRESKVSLVPFRVELCKQNGLLASIRYVDLADKTEVEAEQILLKVMGEPDNLEQFTASATDEVTYEGSLRQRKQLTTVQGFVEWLSDDLGLEMIQIPAGSFVMGSPEDEEDRQLNEGPQHLVSVPMLFMGRYVVTQAQWRFVAELPQVERELDPDPSNFKGDAHPVEKVSWFDAVEFCQRLSQFTGRLYGLPTEAEWEYACRAGTTTPFHFGETITTDLANYRGTDDETYGWSGSYGKGPKGDYRKKTTPVEYFDDANEFGLSDMYGNVWEWCEDQYHDSYEGAPIDGSAWVDREDEKASRMLRGGSWPDSPRDCRSAYRLNGYPDFRYNVIGFRVVCRAPRT